ncbi:PilN domain-containing protein [Actinoplanes subglobosus]|uniref:PilN domain-containing protein n=1 Tax=Actinoplanes subglobosus TaxID=1547892 RepID=A0ABV8J6Q6_9ACTN
MTTTALMPVDPSVSPQQAARVLSIRADLLPPEIRDGRRSRKVRSLIAFVVLLVVAGLGVWYWQATQAKQTADEEYEQMFQTLTRTRAAQKTDELKALVEYQDGGKLLNTELTAILADDLSWTNLLNLIQKEAADEKVELTEISGGLSAENSGTTSDSSTIGTLTISGQADNKKIVADYVNDLGTLKHVTNPFVTSVNKVETGRYAFSLTVTVTSEALCGRFTSDCPKAGE